MTPYGHCVDCPFTAATREEHEQHLNETYEASRTPEGARSHTMRVGSRERRELSPEEAARRDARYEVEALMDRLVDEFCEKADDLIHRGLATDEDVTAAVRSYGDFEDAWENWQADAEEEDRILEEIRAQKAAEAAVVAERMKP